MATSCSDYSRICWARGINGGCPNLLWEWIFSDLSGLFAWHNKSTPMTSRACEKPENWRGREIKTKKERSEQKENRARSRRAFNPFWHRSRGRPVTFSFYSAVLFSLQFRSSFRPEVRPPYARTFSCHKVDFRRVWHRQSQLRVQWPSNFNLTPQMENKSYMHKRWKERCC